MAKFATTTANQLWGFTRYLQREGVHVESYLLKHRLPLLLLRKPGVKVSTKLVYEFIDDIAIAESRDLLGWQVGEFRGWHALEDVSARALINAKALEDVLKNICKLTGLGASHANFFLRYSSGYLEFCHVGGVGRETAGYFHIETYLVSVLIDLIRRNTQCEDYFPEIIRLRSGEVDTRKLSSVLSVNCIESDQEYTSISIPSDIAALPAKHVSVETLVQADFDLPKVEVLGVYRQYPSLRALIELLLPYAFEGLPDLDTIAKIADVGKRTLQRDLSEGGVSIRELGQQLKADIAQGLLAKNMLSIEEISTLLGYKQTTHFVRAFKKSVNITPKQFQLLSEL